MKPLILTLILMSNIGLATAVSKTAFLRLDGAIFYPQVSPNSRYLAYADNEDRGLKIIDLKTRAITEVTQQLVGDSFFWAPNSFRLFYREMYRQGAEVYSEVKAFDLALGESINLLRTPGTTGLLTFDPRDFRLYLMTEKGIIRRQLSYPDLRLHKWRRSLQSKIGYWVAAQNQVVWLSANGISMRSPLETVSGVQSFDVSRDGQAIVWADSTETIYYSRGGDRAKVIGRGLDPQWHPNGQLVVFAKAIYLANKIIDHDIAVTDLSGSQKSLTLSLNSDDRFPVWVSEGNVILYTTYNSTDLYELSFKL